MADIANTLAERGNRYGVFAEHANITQRLKMVMYDTPKFGDLENDQIEALDMIAHKIGRILNGDPNYADSWIDIAGYAKLVADRLELREKNIAAENLAKEVSRIDQQARDLAHVEQDYTPEFGPTGDGWIAWKGGEMPVPEGTPIKRILRDGDVATCRAGDDYSDRWCHLGVRHDIVGYRIIQSEPEYRHDIGGAEA